MSSLQMKLCWKIKKTPKSRSRSPIFQQEKPRMVHRGARFRPTVSLVTHLNAKQTLCEISLVCFISSYKALLEATHPLFPHPRLLVLKDHCHKSCVPCQKRGTVSSVGKGG